MPSMSEKAIDYFNEGRLDEARKLAKKLLKEEPENPEVLHFLGQISLREGKYAQTISLVKRAINHNPLQPLFHETIAIAYGRNDDISLAERECQLALELDADLHGALNTLGLVYSRQRKYKEAIQIFLQAIEKKPDNIEAMNNLSIALTNTGQYSLARKYLKLVLKADPNNARAWNNLSVAFRGERRIEEAKVALLKSGKNLHSLFNLGQLLLLEDKLSEGLFYYETRKKLLGIGKDINKPEWDGSPMPQKRLLVVDEQGLGDAILISRLYSYLESSFKKVFIQTQKPLLRLMQTIDTGIEFILPTDKVGFDLWCPSMSLPFLLKIDAVEKIPQAPWFNIPKDRPQGGKLRIGLNWAGNPAYSGDVVRSTHLQELEMLLQVKDAQWFSLHRGHREDEAEHYKLPQPLKDAGDFYDSAVFINSLDMVISTETAIPNLSAALGITTCVLTTPDYDWRWGSWYRSAIPCPQDRHGNWYGPIYKALSVIRDRLMHTS
jgi:tetratricopeptide (TPR) repeat protein